MSSRYQLAFWLTVTLVLHFPASAQGSAQPGEAGRPKVERLSDTPAAALSQKLQKKYGAKDVRLYRVNGHLAVLLVRPAFYKAPHVLLDQDAKLASKAHEAKVTGLLRRYETSINAIAMDVMSTYSPERIGSQLGLQISNENPGGQELTLNLPVTYLKSLQSRPLDARAAGQFKQFLTKSYAPSSVKLTKNSGRLVIQLNQPAFYKVPNVLFKSDLTTGNSGANAKVNRLKDVYATHARDVFAQAVKAFPDADIRAYVVRLGHLSGNQWVYLELSVGRDEAARLKP